jgi:hypothetical protein
MAYAQKPDFVFLRNGRVHLNRQGRQFSRILAAELCASAVVMLDTLCSEVVCRVLATHSIRQFPLHFPSRALPCAITFQLDSTMTPSSKRPLLCAQGRSGFTKWIVLFTLLIVAVLSEWLEGSWLYSGLLVPNLCFLFK